MKDIELIEQYLLQQLDAASVAKVEERLQNDPPFRDLLNDVQMTIDTLKRQWLKDEIRQVKRQFFYKKVLMTGIIVATVFLTVLYLAGVLSPQSSVNSEAPKKTETIFPADTSEGREARLVIPLEKRNDSVHVQIGLKIPGDFSFRSDTSYKNSANSNPVVTTPEVQVFYIDNTRDNQIQCSGGTIVQIKANTLVTESGVGSLNKVRVSITEFDNYFKMWQHRITTCSDGKLLESGGSCYIEASGNGEKVKVQEGKDFTVRFASAQDSAMGTFYGERDSLDELNWHADNYGNRGQNNEVKANNRFNLKMLDTVYYLEPIISDEEYFKKSNSYHFDQIALHTDLNVVFDTLANIPREDAKKCYLTNKNLLFRFGVDSSGKIYGYDYNFIVSRKLEKQLKRAAQYIVDNRRIERKDLSFDRAIINVSLKALFRVVEKDSNIFLDSNLNKLTNLKDKKQVYNSIVSSAFGYINCDKLYNGKELTDIMIKVQDQKTDVRVFFRDFNAVVNCTYRSGNAVFENAPKYAPILIVATVQIKGQLMMCMQEAEVGETIILRDLEQFDLVKLKHRLLGYREENQ